MCGIYGYIGEHSAGQIIVKGLRSLEYRGYDSAGIAVIDNVGNINISKFGEHKSSIDKLTKSIKDDKFNGNIGIGHTRWATHGEISKKNSHPHSDSDNTVAIVHNGIVENYLEIKQRLESLGVKFSSQTDSEIIANYLSYEIKKGENLLKAVSKLKKVIRGNSSILAISILNPEEIIGIRLGNAGGIVVGLDDNATYISSDLSALLPRTNKILYLENQEIIKISNRNYKLYNSDLEEIDRSPQKIEVDKYDVDKGEYPHYMIKEINEQPNSIQSSIAGRINFSSNTVTLPEIDKKEINISEFNRIIFTGMGTSLHAAMYGAYIFENILGIASSAENSSELRYRNPVIDDKTLLIAITQSGETADTLSAIEHFKNKSCKVISIVESFGTEASRISDSTIRIKAGQEIGVAATKTLTSTMVTLIQLALFFNLDLNKSVGNTISSLIKDISILPSSISEVLNCETEIKKLGNSMSVYSNILYLGRGINISTALEGALKMKEIAYLHAEGYPAGEMKHGVNALLGSKMPTILIIPDDELFEKNLGTINEVKARGSKTLVITDSNSKDLRTLADDLIVVPRINNLLSPILFIIALQIIAYHTAISLNLDPDKPRNLAKTVTVE